MFPQYRNGNGRAVGRRYLTIWVAIALLEIPSLSVFAQRLDAIRGGRPEPRLSDTLASETLDTRKRTPSYAKSSVQPGTTSTQRRSDAGALYANNPPVHQWIALQAFYKLIASPGYGDLVFEMQSFLPTDSDNQLYRDQINPLWADDPYGPASASEALIEGCWEEDAGTRWSTHFWYPESDYDDGIGGYDSALQSAQLNMTQAVEFYNAHDKAVAYYFLGRTAHLLMDMSVPAHTLGDAHLPSDPDSYESFTAADLHFRGIGNNSDHTEIPNFDDLKLYPGDTPIGYDGNLTTLMYNLALYSHFWDSDDADGQSAAYGMGKFTTARNTLDQSRVFASAELRSLLLGKIRDLAHMEDYDIFSVSGDINEYSIYYYHSFYDGYHPPLEFVRVYYTDGNSEDLTPDLVDSVPDSVLECLYQPELESRAIGYVAALFQTFWDSVPHEPKAAINLSPSDRAVNVDVSTNLAWTDGGGATAFDIYFGTDEAAVLSATPSSAEYRGYTSLTSYNPGMDYYTLYYWRIDAKNSAGTTKGDVWWFRTVVLGPEVPSLLEPGPDAIGVSLAVTLDWADAERAETYDVYLWREVDPMPDTPTAVDLSESRYDPPGDLSYSTRYHWLVIARNAGGRAESPEWVFTTLDEPISPPDPPSSPDPATGASNVSRAVVLDWADAARAEKYDLYLWKEGEAKPGTPTAADFTASQYDPPGDLDYSTLYHWQVTAKNTAGNKAGPEWSFTTLEETVNPPDPPASPSPASGATSVSRAVVLDWADAARAEKYDLYLWKDGQSKPGSPTAADLTASEYDPSSDLDYSTLYRWQVTAKNTAGNKEGPEWTFTTLSGGNNSPSVAIASPASDQNVPNTTTEYAFSGTATDPDGDATLAEVQYSVRGGAWQTASGTTSWSFTATGLVVGANLVEVRARDNGDAYSPTASRTITRAEETGGPLLYNISTRGAVGTESSAMFAGFIIEGGPPKTVAVTGWGPRLADFGVTNVLADPLVTVYQDLNPIGYCDNWKTSPYKDQLIALGLAPVYDLEAGVVLNLAPGEYTAILEGVGNQGLRNGLVAVWDGEIAPASKITNLSTRGWAGSGQDVIIAGLFIIHGDSPKSVGITAWGPKLVELDVPNALANPKLAVYDKDQTQIAACDDWQNSPYKDAAIAAGLAPAYPAESVIIMTLDPSEYTAILSGADGGVGNAIVAVWDLD